MSEPDSQDPYMDDYSFGNCFDRILWRPGHPLFQKELNAFQSSRLNQQHILTDRMIPEGTILSGMGVSVLGSKSDTDVPDGANNNLFKFSGKLPDNSTPDLSTINGDITDNVQTYNKSGEIDYQSTATADDQETGLDIFYSQPVNQDNQVIDRNTTLSFDIEEISGTSNGILNNLSVIPSGGSNIISATIDGYPVSDDLTRNSGNNIHVLENNVKQPLNISDGDYHQVIVTFDNVNAGNTEIECKLLFNSGFSALAGSNVRINHMKIEAGTKVTAWNSADALSGTQNERNLTINVSSGSLYLDGQPRVFNNQSIDIQGYGSEQVGVKLTHDIVTPNEDHNLNDNTPGAEDDGAAGADREHYNIHLTYNTNTDQTADAIIFYFQNGKLVANADSRQYDKLNSTLATRTYEQSGSFLSWGMGMTPHADPYNSKLIDIQFGEGAAYVLGHRIYTDGTQTLQIPTESGVASETEELQPFTENPNGTYKYIFPSVQPIALPPLDDEEKAEGLGSSDVGLLVEGSATALYTEEQSQNASDDLVLSNNQLPDNANVESYEVYAQDPRTHSGEVPISKEANGAPVYHITVEDSQSHLIIDNDSTFNSEIDGANTTFYVKCTIHRPFIDQDVSHMPSDYCDENNISGDYYDYRLVFIDGNGNIAQDYDPTDPNMRVGIDFNKDSKDGFNPTGATPLLNSQVDITYQAFRSRDDLIVLNANGTFHDVMGQPGLANEIQPPVNNSTNTNRSLSIGTVHILPNCQQATTQMATIPALPFSNLNDMALQINSLQSNMAILAARQSSIASTDPATLKDTFSDFFINQDKSDISYDRFNIMYSPFQYITPRFSGEGTLPIAEENPTADPDAKTITNALSDVPYINQDISTDTLQLNRTHLILHKAKMICDPSTIRQHYTTDSIHEPTKWRTMNQQQAQQAGVQDIKGGFYTDGDKSRVQDMNFTLPTQRLLIESGQTGTYSTNRSFYITSTYGREAYLMPQWVHIQASGFTPYADNLQVTLPSYNNWRCETTCDIQEVISDKTKFNWDNVYEYAPNENVDPNHTNAVKADSNGNVSCWFLIPGNIIQSGYITVKLSNPAGDFAIDRINANNEPVQVRDYTNDLYINSGTLTSQMNDRMNQQFASANARFAGIDDNIAQIHQFDSATVDALNYLDSNLNSDTASLNSLINSNTASLSTAESNEADDVNAISNAQSITNSVIGDNIGSLSDAVSYNNYFINSVSNSASDGISANADSIQSNADEIAYQAVQFNSDVQSADDRFGSADGRFNSDEATTFSYAISADSDYQQNSADINNLGEQEASAEASAAAAHEEAMAAAAQAQESALDAADLANSNTASINGNTSLINNDVNQQNGINNGFNGRINDNRKATNWNTVANHANNGHDLALYEYSQLQQQGNCTISQTVLNNFINSNNSLFKIGYPYEGGQWPGVSNEAFQISMNTGAIVLPGRSDNPGQPWKMVTCIPAHTSWYQYGGNKDINGRSVFHQDNANYSQTDGQNGVLWGRIQQSLVIPQTHHKTVKRAYKRHHKNADDLKITWLKPMSWLNSSGKRKRRRKRRR